MLDLVRAVQEHVMNASYSVPVTKPLLTKNIRKFLKRIYRRAEANELTTKYLEMRENLITAFPFKILVIFFFSR